MIIQKPNQTINQSINQPKSLAKYSQLLSVIRFDPKSNDPILIEEKKGN